MEITRNGRTYHFRPCDVRGMSQDSVQAAADATRHMQYEPNGFSWLVIPGIGYGWEE